MRTSTITRATKETDIRLALNLDGSGKADIQTGIGFFDHMLTTLAMHSGMDLELVAKGDLHVDAHHTVEDTGIVLGKAFAQALGDKTGIVRYDSAYIPMDEALAFCALDISGRPYLVLDADFTADRIGGFDTALTEEFFRALAFNAGITLHLRLLYGRNDHHKCEALFKAAAHALKAAVRLQGRALLSTKGVLE